MSSGLFENPHLSRLVAPALLREAVRLYRIANPTRAPPYVLTPRVIGVLFAVPRMSGRHSQTDLSAHMTLTRLCEKIAQHPPEEFVVMLHKSPTHLEVWPREPAPQTKAPSSSSIEVSHA